MGTERLHSPARPFFLLAGWGTLCLGAAQAAVPLSRMLGSVLDGSVERHPPLLAAGSLAAAAVLVLVSTYAFSAAGALRPLPCTVPVLILAGVALLARGLPLPLQAAGALGQGPFSGSVGWSDLAVSLAAFDLGVPLLIGLAILLYSREIPRASASHGARGTGILTLHQRPTERLTGL